MANKLVFIPNGRLGNAFFRYLACALVNIINPALEYTLQKYFVKPKSTFTYYAGLDAPGNDASTASNQAIAAKEAERDNAIMGYNTLGYLKHTIDPTQLSSNTYVNKDNGQGLYVKKTLTVDDETFFDIFYKKLEYFNVVMDGYFQFGYIYLKYKPHILAYMEEHKHTHRIQTDLNEEWAICDLMEDLVLPPEKQYDVAIHIRLGDFNGRPEFIELEYYLQLFESLALSAEQKICLVYHPTNRPADAQYMTDCLAWFHARNIPVCVESNSERIDLNIMKQAKRLVCSMSTFAWTAAYLSTHIQQCYMPNYNYYRSPDRPACFFFHKPIENTILYPVKTTPPGLGRGLDRIKTQIITLPAYAHRLDALNYLNYQLAKIGLEPSFYEGVNGKDITVYDAASCQTRIKHITWRNTSYVYDMRVRTSGVPMTKGEFGCAWSHLNLLRKLVKEATANAANESYYLILEDDVELVKPLTELYEILQHLPPDTDLCHLAKSTYHPFQKTRAVNAFFYECKKWYFNKTTAYIVSAKGAQKILDYTKHSINVPIDDLFNMIYRLTPDFRFYVPADYFFKEQDNVPSLITAIDRSM
jgi:GR25 family glycosyltransferase involved in LPS biosynthesis